MLKAKLTVLTSSKIGVKAMYSKIVYDTKTLDERPKKSVANQPKKKIKQSKKAIPAKNHPWRQPINKRPILSYEETDSEILEILDDLFNSTRAWA